jgi:ABC-type sugar transport system permease subunit
MAHDVFISYSTIDKTTADAACATLENNGIRCWIAPRNIMPGAEWGAAIISAIDQCKVAVLIFSSHANASKQIFREVQRAIDRGIPVVPVRIEDVSPTEALAYFVGSVHWLDAITPPLERHLQKLADSVDALLHAQAPDMPAAKLQPRPERPSPNTHSPTSAALVANADLTVKTGPFHDLINFGFRRNWLQAIVWYALFVAIGAVLGAIVGMIIGMIANPTEELGHMVGQLTMIPYVILLGALLLYGRDKGLVNIFLVIAALVLVVPLGALGGVLPLAVLSTRPLVTKP